MPSDVARVEPGHEAHGEEHAIVRLDVAQGALEVDDPDGVGRITVAVPVEGRREVDDGRPTVPTDGLAGLVGGDGDEPGSDLLRLSESRQPAMAQADWTASRVASTSPQMT